MDRTGASELDITTVLCDLDGVVWLAHRPIPGAVTAISALRSSGRRVLFVTNNSASTRVENEAALAAIGVAATGDVVSSSMAASTLVEPGERVLVAGGPGVVEAMEERGAVVVLNDGNHPPGAFDAVVVGMHRDFDYARLDSASAAVRAGARLIGTNSDTTFPTPEGLRPGGGSILAAVATASGVEPTIAGKPHQPMVALIEEMLSAPGRPFAGDRTMMVGDRPDTDGVFAEQLGCRFALVRSGVTAPTVQAAEIGMAIELDRHDLAGVAAAVVSGFTPAD